MAAAVGFQTGKSIWYGPDIGKRHEEWIVYLNDEELEELGTASDLLVTSSANENHLSLEALENMSKFSLPLIKARVDNLVERLHDGLGFALWRSIPVDLWPKKRVAAAFLIIGKCIGSLRQQNAKGHVLGHVTDLGLASSDPNVRIYQTAERQGFHTDSADIVGLICLKTAKSGGLSLLVSSGTIFNEMLNRRPDLADELLKPIASDKRGEIAEGELPFHSTPVYNFYEGYLTARYQRLYIDSAQRFPNAPRLTPKQIEVLDFFDSLADDPSLNFTMKFQPGDVQFLNNHSILHDRTGYVDWNEPEKKRHLLRVWVAPPSGRPLPPVMAQKFGSVVIGDRGGFSRLGVNPIAPLYP